MQVGMCDFLQVRRYMPYNRDVRLTRWQNNRLHFLIVEHRNSRNSMTWRANRCSMCYVILCLSFNIIVACLYVYRDLVDSLSICLPSHNPSPICNPASHCVRVLPANSTPTRSSCLQLCFVWRSSSDLAVIALHAVGISVRLDIRYQLVWHQHPVGLYMAGSETAVCMQLWQTVGRAKSVKRFEWSNGLDAALYKNIHFTLGLQHISFKTYIHLGLHAAFLKVTRLKSDNDNTTLRTKHRPNKVYGCLNHGIWTFTFQTPCLLQTGVTHIMLVIRLYRQSYF